MFDLFRSQGKAVKYLLTGMLVILGLSMLVYLVPNYGTDTTGANAVLLQVGQRKLTAADAQAEFEQTTKGRVPPEMISAFFPQWLEQEKQRLAVLEEARRLGITTSTDEVAEALSQAAAFSNYFQNGKLTDRAGFEAAVAQQGLSVEKVFELVADQLTDLKLRDALSQTAVVTPKEVEEAYKRKYERATVDYIAISQDDMRSKVMVTDADVRSQWEKTKASYQQPEKYTFRTVVLSQDTVQSKLNVTEQELKAAYAQALDNYTTPEQVHVRHILVKADSTATADAKEKARKKAEDLLKQLKGGADFAQLAAKDSDDSAVDLGWLGRGTNPEKAFEDAAFSLKPNELSGVVSTGFGYHIIQSLEKKPAQVKPFEEVRGEIENYLRSSKMADTMAATASQLQADLKKDPATAAATAQKFGAQVISVNEALKGAAIPTLGATPEIDNVLAVLQPGGVSDVIAIPGDRDVVVVLDKKIPARESTFEEAQAQVRSTMINELARAMMMDLSKKAGERVRAGEDMKAVAQALGVKVEAASSFGLTDTLPDLGPAVYFEDAFRKGTGTVIGPTLMQGKMVVAKVVSKTDAEMAGLAAEKNSLMLSLRKDRAQQNNGMITDSIVKRLTDEGVMKVDQAELQRLISQLR